MAIVHFVLAYRMRVAVTWRAMFGATKITQSQPLRPTGWNPTSDIRKPPPARRPRLDEVADGVLDQGPWFSWFL